MATAEIVIQLQRSAKMTLVKLVTVHVRLMCSHYYSPIWSYLTSSSPAMVLSPCHGYSHCSGHVLTAPDCPPSQPNRIYIDTTVTDRPSDLACQYLSAAHAWKRVFRLLNDVIARRSAFTLLPMIFRVVHSSEELLPTSK